VAAKLTIAEDVGVSLAKLTPDDRAFIDHVLAETRMRRLVLRRVRDQRAHLNRKLRFRRSVLGFGKSHT
jgi:hypothetical protein